MRFNSLMTFLEIQDGSLSDFELRKVNQLNMMSGYCIVFAVILNLSNLAFGRFPQFFMICGFVLLIFLPTLLLQKRKLYKLARNYFCLLQIPLMLAACIHNIRSDEFVHSENIFLILAPVFVILYERKTKVLLYATTMTCFFFVKFYDYHIRNSDLDDMFYISSAVYLVVFLSIYHFIKSYMDAFFEICQEQSELINRLAIQKNKLEKTNSTKNKLFSIISHDLKSPINMLQGLMQSQDGIPEAELRTHKKYVQENVSKINSLIDTVLTWAKSQLDGFRIEVREITLKELLEKEFEKFKSEADQKNIKVTLESAENLKISSDPNHVALVISNIIANSIEYTPQKGEIHLQVRDFKYYINIEVTDSGFGMSINSIKAILGGRLKTNTSEETTYENRYGLGLSLCMETLEKIGGTMLIESQENIGTKFIVQLPKSILSSEEPSNKES